jgi:hypothetical protein
MMLFLDDDKVFDTDGESRMMPPLVGWLQRKRWVRADSVVMREVPVNGRRVDLVTMTKSGVMSAFELKLGGFGRVLEQAVYNRQTFDKSWIVIGNHPRQANLDQAERFGVGIIVVRESNPAVLLRPGSAVCGGQSRQRARLKLMESGVIHV